MALRYRVPGPLVVEHPKHELKPVLAFKQPVTVEFRAGADMRRVVREVLAEPSVRVDAATGSGKSVVLPKELAMKGRTRVLHVVPNRLLALDLYRYVEKQAAADSAAYPPLVFFENGSVELPSVGVVFAGAADVVAALVKDGGSGILEGKVVYLDEAHESDAYTHLLRNLARSMGASNVVMASATFGAGGFRKRETLGSVECLTYPAEETPETWRVSGFEKPWCIGALKGNLLVFTDSRSQVRALTQLYVDSGMIVFRLHSQMSDAEFTRAMVALRDKNGPLVVLLADYSFRSGFTFDVSTIVDVGRVGYYDGSGGSVRRLSRPLLAFESEQAAGRGGRIPGLKTRYYRPVGELEAAVCELEGTEKEAAAYLSRCLGFKPNGVLASAAMASKLVSGELSDLLNGLTPLPLMAERPTVVQSGFSVSPVQAEVHNRPVSSLGSEGETLCSEVTSEAPEVQDGLESLRAGLADVMNLVDVPSFSVGTYYHVSRADSRGLSMTFPEGLKSVVRVFSGDTLDAVVHGMNAQDRSKAAGLLLERYNVLNADLSALRIALTTKSGILSRSKGNRRVKDYFVKVLERASGYEAERSHLLGLLALVVDAGGMKSRPVDEPTSVIDARAEQYEADFDRVLDPGGSDTSSSYGQSARIEAGLKEISVGVRERKALTGMVEDDGFIQKASGGESGDQDGYSYDVVRLPRWLGMRSVTYKYNEKDDVAGMSFKPGKLLRSLSGSKSWNYGNI